MEQQKRVEIILSTGELMTFEDVYSVIVQEEKGILEIGRALSGQKLYADNDVYFEEQNCAEGYSIVSIPLFNIKSWEQFVIVGYNRK